MTDHITIAFTTAGERRRVRFEPREDGPGMWRWDEVHRGCGDWRTVGVEPVRNVTLTRGPEA